MSLKESLRQTEINTTSDIKSGLNYDAWRIEIRENLHDLSFREATEYILGFGLLAPSAHNKQGWKTEINESNRTLTVWPESSDFGTPSDIKGRETYIGVGCFTENISQALHVYGLSEETNLVEKDYFDKKGNAQKILGKEFDLSKILTGTLQFPEILQTIKKRKANRGTYDSTYQLPQDLIKKFQEGITNSGINLTLIEDKPTKFLIAETQYLADRAVLLLPAFRHELALHMAPGDTEKTRVMPGDTFGLSKESALKITEALLAEGQFDGDFAAGFAAADRDGIASSSAVGIITVDTDTPEKWILAGQTFENIWLETTKNGLSIAVMAGMVESPPHNIMLKTRLGNMKLRPTVVFRIGNALEFKPHAPRITIAELLIK
jgi:hypothetical protein